MYAIKIAFSLSYSQTLSSALPQYQAIEERKTEKRVYFSNTPPTGCCSNLCDKACSQRAKAMMHVKLSQLLLN